jgi:hypothetical protein
MDPDECLTDRQFPSLLQPLDARIRATWQRMSPRQLENLCTYPSVRHVCLLTLLSAMGTGYRHVCRVHDLLFRGGCESNEYEETWADRAFVA